MELFSDPFRCNKCLHKPFPGYLASLTGMGIQPSIRVRELARLASLWAADETDYVTGKCNRHSFV